jgi:hypothetical protein
MSTAQMSNKGKFTPKCYSPEVSMAWLRLTTDAGIGGIPTVTVNGGGIEDADVAIVDNGGAGDFTITLRPKFKYLAAWANVQEAGYYCSCTCTEGTATANKIQIEIFLGAAGATAAADPTSEVIDILIWGFGREETAA